MGYQGGKSRIAKPLAQIITTTAGGADCFVSLFCGSCAVESKRSLLKDMATLQDAHFVCEDYRRVCIPPGAVIYADPPYNNTTGYSGERFDSSEFWRAMRLLADTGHTVFVSEQEAPPGIECIWEKPFTRTLDRNKGNQFTVTEKLFYLPPTI